MVGNSIISLTMNIGDTQCIESPHFLASFSTKFFSKELLKALISPIVQLGKWRYSIWFWMQSFCESVL